MTTRVSTTASPPCGAKGCAPYRVCICGTAFLVAQPTGRPRLTCSAGCRRHRDRLLKQHRRRLEWVALWQAEIGRGYYTPKEIAAEVRQLESELQVLKRKLQTTMHDLPTIGEAAPELNAS